MTLRDRDIHRCPGCAGWKLRSRECVVCQIALQEECLRAFRLREALEHEHTIARRQAVLRGVA